MVVFSKNPVHSVLWLIVVFFAISGHYILMNAQFLAIVNLIVYAGAIMVLFLFVVMMLDINLDGVRKGFWQHFPLAAAAGTLIALEMSAVLMGGFRLGEPPKAAAVVGQAVVELSNTKELGKLLYSQYLYPLEVAAVILLVAIIAAIALTLRERKDSKHIDPADQIRVKRADRVRLVKVNPTMAAPLPQDAPDEEKKA